MLKIAFLRVYISKIYKLPPLAVDGHNSSYFPYGTDYSVKRSAPAIHPFILSLLHSFAY